MRKSLQQYLFRNLSSSCAWRSLQIKSSPHSSFCPPGYVSCRTSAAFGYHIRSIRTTPALYEDIDRFHDLDTNSWLDYGVSASRQIGTDDIKRWPLHERIEAAGPGYINIARKTRNALRQIDRILDVFEPGQLALSFNGGKDSTALLNLFIAACAQHPTHSFTHIQPIWFRHPEHEFPELVKYVEDTAEAAFTHHEGLKAVDGSKLSRLPFKMVARACPVCVGVRRPAVAAESESDESSTSASVARFDTG